MCQESCILMCQELGFGFDFDFDNLKTLSEPSQ